MGFLAFLLIGAISGICAWWFYPGSKLSPSGFKKPLISMFLGVLACALSAYIGQMAGIFQAGQMLEWLLAVLSACLVSCIYVALVK